MGKEVVSTQVQPYLYIWLTPNSKTLDKLYQQFHVYVQQHEGQDRFLWDTVG